MTDDLQTYPYILCIVVLTPAASAAHRSRGLGGEGNDDSRHVYYASRPTLSCYLWIVLLDLDL
eukprot:COSAG06_NODE_54007_length_297_cov_0.358586_1_plen_62_part_01